MNESTINYNNMSIKSLLHATQGKYYNSINSPTIEQQEPVVSTVQEAENERQARIDYHRKQQCIVVVFVIIVMIILCILMSILYVAICACIEYIIVSMFGRAVYNKNFPVCSSSIYTGNGCYTTTSTYCTN